MSLGRIRAGGDLVVTVEVDARVGGVVELGVEPLELLERQLRDRPSKFSHLFDRSTFAPPETNRERQPPPRQEVTGSNLGGRGGSWALSSEQIFESSGHFIWRRTT